MIENNKDNVGKCGEGEAHMRLVSQEQLSLILFTTKPNGLSMVLCT